MNNYTEKFEKMRIAGKLASQTLDMLTENIKEGISTCLLYTSPSPRDRG